MRHAMQHHRNRADTFYYRLAFRLGLAALAFLLAFFVIGALANKASAPDRYTFEHPVVEKTAPPPPAKSIGIVEGRWCLDFEGPCVVYTND